MRDPHLAFRAPLEPPATDLPPPGAPPHASVRHACHGGSVIELAGRLPDRWVPRLASGCAARGVALVRGGARRVGAGGWLARIETAEPASLGKEEILRWIRTTEAPQAGMEPAILHFELAESSEHGGCLALEVHAWDAIGLLAAVAGRAARVGLHPAAVVLETEDRCAFHRLLLQTERWRRPSRRDRRALVHHLAAMLRAG